MEMIARAIIFTGIITFLPACVVHNVNPSVELISSDEIAIPEDELLNLGISVFTPLVEFSDSEDINIANLRDAEALYSSWHLAKALSASKHWGMVQVAPQDFVFADVWVSGKILQSDGQTMRIQIKVEDASGLVWFDRLYQQVLSESYPVNPAANQIPFQSLYLQIANDIRGYAVDNFSRKDFFALHNVSQIRFASRFAPEKYQPYLEPVGSGRVNSNRLPAINDDIFKYINNIQNRHFSFLDALQGQYDSFITQIEAPYREFIRLSYRTTEYVNDELIQIEEDLSKGSPVNGALVDRALENSKVTKMSGSRIDRSEIKSNNLNSGARRRIYSSNLALSGQVFEQEIAPITVQAINQSVELSGSVDEQYEQWQQILQQMIELELNTDQEFQE